MEGQQLQRYDAQDALQAVHTVRHVDGAAGVLDGLVIIFVADHNRTALYGKKYNKIFLKSLQTSSTSCVDLILNLEMKKKKSPTHLGQISHLLNPHLLHITDSSDVTLNQPLPRIYRGEGSEVWHRQDHEN